MDRLRGVYAWAVVTRRVPSGESVRIDRRTAPPLVEV